MVSRLINSPCDSEQTFGVSGVDHPLSVRDQFNLKDAAVSYIQSRLNVSGDAVDLRKVFTNDVTQHAFVLQQIVRICWHLNLVKFTNL